MSNIRFDRVDISLAQFQAVSSGKYNAGEIKLAGEHTLAKTNNHVTWTGSNTSSLSHQEVLAIKHALVRGLADAGVAAGKLDAIRADLGLAARPGGGDKDLHERSIKPLTRQQVREILDDNATTINGHLGAGTIRTSGELSAGLSEATRAQRAAARDGVNASLDGKRAVRENRDLALAEMLAGGDVGYLSYEREKDLLAFAKSQLKEFLEACNGEPDPETPAVLSYTMTGGQVVRMDTSISQADYVRRLDETVMRLTLDKGGKSTQFHEEFAALRGADARSAWLDSLAGTKNAGLKARVAAITMMWEAGITDGDTLELVNYVQKDDVIAFAKTLAGLDGTVTGEALRAHECLSQLSAKAHAPGAPRIPSEERARVPAMTSRIWNEAIWNGIANKEPDTLPHEFAKFVRDLSGALRERFGEKVVPQGMNAGTFIESGRLTPLLPHMGLDLRRVELGDIQGQLEALATSTAATKHASQRLRATALAAGGTGDTAHKAILDLQETRPELWTRLSTSRTAAAIDAILEEARADIEANIRRLVAIDRARTAALATYRFELAKALGVPPAVLSGDACTLSRLKEQAQFLGNDIRSGKIAAGTDAEIAAVFRDFAVRAVRQRAEALAKVDELGLEGDFADAVRDHVLYLERPEKVDVAATLEGARKAFAAQVETIEQALDDPNGRDTVLAAMQAIGLQFGNVIHGLFPPGQEVGGNEMETHGRLMMLYVTRSKPGLAAKLAAFLDRADIRALGDDTMPGTPAGAVFLFRQGLLGRANNESIADSLGKPTLPPLHAQALQRAFADAGLGELSPAARAEILRPTNPVGRALAEAIRKAGAAVEPTALRALAVAILREKRDEILAAAAAPDARATEAANRRRTLLETYTPGLPAETASQLRLFAETLDFSPEAAKESERLVTEFLDEATGGGGFNNPLSPASHLAIARGAKMEDLPGLANLHDLVHGTYVFTAEEEVEQVADPQSNSRRLFAAGGRFAVNDRDFDKGLTLMGKFSAWYDALPEVPGQAKLPAAEAERKVFAHLAAHPEIDLATDKSDELFAAALAA